MLTLTANFDGSTKSMNVTNITMGRSLMLEDGSYINIRTFNVMSSHPELILRQKKITGKCGEILTFWE